MEFYKYVEELQHLLSNASKVPFSSKVIIENEKALELLDGLIRCLPNDLKHARKVVEDRQKILVDAQKEAEIIVKEAKRSIEKMVNEEEVTRLAQEKSEHILTFAKQTARDIRIGANDYADEVLAQLEDRLNKILETIKRGREEINQNR